MITFINKNIDIKKLKMIFITVLIGMLAAHGYCYFNFAPNGDSLTNIYNNNFQYYFALGRYFRNVYLLIRGNMELPVLTGFLSIVFLTISVYFLIETLDFNKKISVIIASLILVCSSSLTILNAAYLHDSDAYLFSLMLCSIGTYLLIKHNKYWLVSVVLYVMSLGIYQAYIGFAIATVLIIYISKFIENNNLKTCIIEFIKNMFVIGLSLVVYYAIFKIINNVLNLEASGYYQDPANALNFSLNAIADKLILTYETTKNWLLNPCTSHANVIKLINIVIVLAIAILLVLKVLKNQTKTLNIVLASILFVAYPLGNNFITFLYGSSYEVTLYPLCIIYIFMIYLLDKYEFNKKIINEICILFVSIVLFNNAIFSNAIYMQKELEKESTLFTFARIVNRVEETDGYVAGETKVAIIGKLSHSILNVNRAGLTFDETGINENYLVDYYGTYVYYLNYYLAYPINTVSESDANELRHNDDYVKSLPSFPDKGSVVMHNDTLIIKLSD